MSSRVLLLDLWGSNRRRLPGCEVALACFAIKLEICARSARLLIGGKTVLQDLKLVALQRRVPSTGALVKDAPWRALI